MKIGVRAAGIFMLGLIWVMPALSQTQATTGTIQGRVEDQQGAVIQGALVEARNTETNFSKQQQTDGDGRFVLLALPPGPYTVTVSGKQGFGTVVQENIDLTVGKAVSLPLVMRISESSERVVVTDTPLIDAVKTEASTTIDQRTVANTPILGRKFEDLLTLTPGVSVVQGPDGDEINFNGQRGIFNNISLDGGDYNNGFFGEQLGGQRGAIDITMDAIGEFQVVASGASAEFGRTAGGVVNVVTKSGTNDVHGSLFHYQRLEGLTANTSDGKPLRDFHREQFGGTIGGPVKTDKLFFFGAFEQILANLTRENLSSQTGDTACPVAAPAIGTDESAINGNPDCQRLALLDFLQNSIGQNEGLPVKHPIRNSALLGKMDWNVNPANKLSVSYNFDYSKNENQTFDVATYGTSANGTEGPTKINVLNANFFTTVNPRMLNEAHFTYANENRPRSATPSNLTADTAMGFAPTFRFGNPFFLGPNVDEKFWRTHAKDNFSIVSGTHTVKFGGEWIHSDNSQVFRGFFQGRYLFDSVSGFLRYASPAAAGGFGPQAERCDDGTWITDGLDTCADASAGSTPLLLFLQGAGRTGLATDAAGFSDVSNEDLSLFVQDKWQIVPNFTLSYGLRWEAQLMAEPVVPASETVYGPLLGNPAFPSDGTIPDQWKQIQPRVGFAWDVTGKQKSVLRANAGIYYGHQNMLSQVGSITTNGVQQQTISAGPFNSLRPVWPNLVEPDPLPDGEFPLFSGVRVFDRNYKNPRIYSWNAQYEQELVTNLSLYADFTWSKGVYLTDFLDYNRADRGAIFSPLLGETMVTSSRANSLYRGFTIGARKRLSQNYQFEGNYVYSRDYDNDSNERDPFTDRSGLASVADPFPLRNDYAASDRDIRHKFNFWTSGQLPWKLDGNLRLQIRSAQPITPLGGPRNSVRKDNAYSSVDWRVSRPFTFGERYRLVPTVEMFNTFNSANNINPLTSPGLFNFDGFLRQGVGDPRTVQLAVKFQF